MQKNGRVNPSPAVASAPAPSAVANPAFFVGGIPVCGRVFLAPMANFSDSPYRRMVRRRGCALSYSEFVPARAIVRREEQFMDMFRHEEEERPVILQIFGADLETVAQAASIAESCGADIVDLNMGCSVKDVVQKGAGAGLLRNPILAGEIIEAMRSRVRIPVTAKIRLGWTSDTRNYLETAHILEESGVSMISVHGRTREAGYTGLADWDAIAEVKSRAKIPVLGSGDVKTWHEADARLAETGVDGVLVGRAGAGNPWLFSRRDRIAVPFEEVKAVMREHWAMMHPFYGPHSAVLFRKHAVRYLPYSSHEDEVQLRNQLMRSEAPEDVDAALS